MEISAEEWPKSFNYENNNGGLLLVQFSESRNGNDSILHGYLVWISHTLMLKYREVTFSSEWR